MKALHVKENRIAYLLFHFSMVLLSIDSKPKGELF
jgi:hypothetical protein